MVLCWDSFQIGSILEEKYTESYKEKNARSDIYRVIYGCLLLVLRLVINFQLSPLLFTQGNLQPMSSLSNLTEIFDLYLSFFCKYWTWILNLHFSSLFSSYYLQKKCKLNIWFRVYKMHKLVLVFVLIFDLEVEDQRFTVNVSKSQRFIVNNGTSQNFWGLQRAKIYSQYWWNWFRLLMLLI